MRVVDIGEIGRRVPGGLLDVREQVIRQIRQWKADLVLAPRPNDYHPDHRYTGVLVQDAAYMVVVPNIASDTPALRKNPVFMYFEDRFQKPAPFRPDVAISIDDVIEKKIDMLDAHVSQMYEWLPWVDNALEKVPSNAAERRAWLRHVVAWAVGCALIGLAVVLVGDPSRTEALAGVAGVWTIVLVIDGVISLSYTLSPRKPKQPAPQEPERVASPR